jgi:cellulose synthase/poly-beta-1,6-N-acetylglucosamine synthase-like glycosyltransferase
LNTIFNKKNVGYGAACNAAIDHARGEYLLCMNPDVRLEYGALEALIKGIRATGAWIVGPRFYWDKGKNFLLPPSIPENWLTESISFWAARLRVISSLWSRWWARREQIFWKAESPLSQTMISGACFLADREALMPDRTLFDPSFFLYYEDTELCRRIRRQGGEVYFFPEAQAIHLYAQSPASPEFKNAQMAKSQDLYRRGYTWWQRQFMHLQSRHGNSLFSTRSYDNGCYDLDELDGPPDLSWNEKGACWLRVGVNPLFVPSAGTLVTGGHFKFPSGMWRQMAPGTYFLETRHSHSWRRIGFWSWRKGCLN